MREFNFLKIIVFLNFTLISLFASSCVKKEKKIPKPSIREKENLSGLLLAMTNKIKGSLIVLDAKSGNVLFEIPVGNSPATSILNTDEKTIFVGGEKIVYMIDLKKRIVMDSIKLKSNPAFLFLPSPTTLLTVDRSCGVTLIDLIEKTQKASVSLKGNLVNAYPTSKNIFILSQHRISKQENRNSLYSLNIPSLKTQISISSPNLSDFALTPTAERLFLIIGDTLKVYSGDEGVLLSMTSLPSECSVLTSTPSGNKLYILSQINKTEKNERKGIIYVFRRSTNKIISEIFLSALPDTTGRNTFVFSEDGSRLVLSHGKLATLSLINAGVDSLKESIEIPYEPRNIILSPKGDYAFLISKEGDMDIIDLSMGRTIKTFKGPGFSSILLFPASGLAKDTLPPTVDTLVKQPDTLPLDTLPGIPDSLLYTVQVSSFSEQERAFEFAKALITKGYTQTEVDSVTLSSGKQVFRVRIGIFKTNNEAQAFAERLRKIENLDAWVVQK